MSYAFEVAGLAEAIARTPATPGHKALLTAIRAHEPLDRARLVTCRGDAWLATCKVLDTAGQLVHPDHRAWLRAEAEADGGRLRRTLDRLKDLDYQLTRCDITTLYVVHDRGGLQHDFIQLTIDQQDEHVDRRLFESSGNGWWRDPKDIGDLCQASEDGPRLTDDQRQRYRPSAYRLTRVIDFTAFLREAGAIEAARRAVQRQKSLLVTDAESGRTVRMTVGELDPDGARFDWPGQRMLDDWTSSSAGRSGARICDHWAFQTSDYTDANGVRSLSFIPAWTYGRRLAEIARAPKSTHELLAKLESMDRRLGVPFGWYFYMLHGNRVHDWAGRRILKAAQAGTVALPEHDYRVLRNWQERPYGF